MKRTILTVLLTAFITAYLVGGSHAPMSAVQVKAQSVNPRGDLVTAFRQDVNNINSSFDAFTAHSGVYISSNTNFVVGDLAGANITNPSTFVADDVDQARTDLADIINKVKNGGSIGVGQWANVLKIR